MCFNGRKQRVDYASNLSTPARKVQQRALVRTLAPAIDATAAGLLEEWAVCLSTNPGSAETQFSIALREGSSTSCPEIDKTLLPREPHTRREYQTRGSLPPQICSDAFAT